MMEILMSHSEEDAKEIIVMIDSEEDAKGMNVKIDAEEDAKEMNVMIDSEKDQTVVFHAAAHVNVETMKMISL